MSESSNHNHQKKRSPYYMVPLVSSITLCIGMFLGSQWWGKVPTNTVAERNIQVDKVAQILKYIDQFYLDTVDTEELTDFAIEKALEKLDPHTVYIPTKDSDIFDSQLNDGFDGVGIEFRVIRDTIKVLSVVPGGPSDKAGIRAGDQIIKVDGQEVAGTNISSDRVVRSLRGKKGTKVNVEIARLGLEKSLSFDVKRDKIATHAVEVSYMLNEDVGFIKLDRFSENTYDEFKESLDQLIDQGMTQLILDLRDNGGGYLGHAVKVCEEFLKKDMLIVYTDGKGDYFDDKEFASRTGSFSFQPLIVLVNEYSASASEIVTGALQDHDRALVVGRRSYGKGLVQRQIRLDDGSLLRLTISRYYTPSGRSIQKPYIKGSLSDYDLDLQKRMNNGELFHEDSISLDTAYAYKTTKGRTVYAGGGVIPDVFVPLDTTFYTPYYRSLLRQDAIRDYAIMYANEHQGELKEMGLESFINEFEVQKSLISRIEKYVLKFYDNISYKGKESSLAKITAQFKEQIAYVVWGKEAYYKVRHQYDTELQVAIENFETAEKLVKN